MLWKELRESRWRFIIGLIVFVLFAASLPLLYEWLFKEFLKETLKTIPFPLPKEALAQIELMEKQYDFYIWSQWFGKNLYQFSTILAILMGMGLFASEASKQTMEFLLSKPISRNRVALVKFLVGALEIAIIVAVSSFSIYPAAKFTGHDVELSRLIIGSVPTCVGLLLIYALTFFFSSLVDDPVKVGVLSAVTALLLSIPGWFSKTRAYSIFAFMQNKEAFFQGKLPWLEIAVVLGFVLLFYLATLGYFKQKDY